MLLPLLPPSATLKYMFPPAPVPLPLPASRYRCPPAMLSVVPAVVVPALIVRFLPATLCAVAATSSVAFCPLLNPILPLLSTIPPVVIN